MNTLDDFLTEHTVTANQIQAANKKLHKLEHAASPSICLISRLASYIGACEAHLNAAELLRASLTKDQLAAKPHVDQMVLLTKMTISKHLLLNAL
jgi:hypothetical protein